MDFTTGYSVIYRWWSCWCGIQDSGQSSGKTEDPFPSSGPAKPDLQWRLACAEEGVEGRGVQGTYAVSSSLSSVIHTCLTEYQQRKWYELCKNCSILGCSILGLYDI